MADYENYEPLDPHAVCRRVLREKDWEIQLLRAERDECRRLLREFVEWSEPSGCGTHNVSVSDEWMDDAEQAARAAGGE